MDTSIAPREAMASGLGIARAVAEAGMNVVLNGLAMPGIDNVCAAIERDYGVVTAFSAADMSRPTEIVAIVGEAATRFGSVDVLVNNARIQHVEAIETFPPEKWNQIIATNLSAAFHTIRAARMLTEDQVIRDVLLKAQPTRRFVTVEEIGAIALVLVSDAALSITGAALPVEGGWTAQ